MSEEAVANAPGPSEQAQTMSVKVEIVVQPPLAVGVRRRLIPPVVARTENRQLLEDYMSGKKSVFGTLMLTASNGDDMTTLLTGNYQVQGQPVTVHPENSGGGSSSSSSSRHKPHKYIYFIFNGLSITVPGTYTITVCVNALILDQGCVMTVGGKASRAFNVVEQAVAPARPSKLIDVPVGLGRQNTHWNYQALPRGEFCRRWRISTFIIPMLKYRQATPYFGQSASYAGL